MLRCGDMWRAALIVLLVAYLPGASIFRFPTAGRRVRAMLSSEERLFWVVSISLALSSFTALALAAGGIYHIDHLLWVNGGITVTLAIISRARLRLEDTDWPSWSAVAPALLLCIAAGMFFFVPPSEYVMGERDPGVYINEGIQIAQHGSLVIDDQTVSTVPTAYRRLFFPPRPDPRFDQGYDSLRFMGFFILDPAAGVVVGQFPHLYPIWVAIGYDTYGLTGARYVLGLWAVFSVLAVYFVGAALLGRPAAFAGAGLLTLHVAQVWYARYPNAEVIMQGLIFTGLLAYTRAHVDGNRFFAPIAAIMFGLSLFAHITSILAIAGVGLAALLGRYAGHRVQLRFIIPLLVITVTAVAYYLSVLTPYSARYTADYSARLQPMHYALLTAGSGAIVYMLATRSTTVVTAVRKWLPVALLVSIWLSALYALFLREGGGALPAHDAAGLRTFTGYYLSPLGLAAALVGWTIVIGRRFWNSSAFHIVAAIFAFFIFYKSRIVPEHFWMARRFLPIILPTSLLFIGAAAFTKTTMPTWPKLGWSRDGGKAYAVRATIGIALVAWLGLQYVQDTKPILRHIEFAGLIPKLEELAGRFTPEDLVLVESRGPSDVHVLATPLDYIYTRNVLVFDEPTPDIPVFQAFLEWARSQYDRVFFIGGSGTDLLSRSTVVMPVSADRFQIPEYERALNAYPTEVRQKEFDYSVYELVPGRIQSDAFNLDVGTIDDLYVRRIHAKQRDQNGVTYRWTRDRSFVSIIATLPDAELLTLHMNNGGRPTVAGAARVRLTLNDRPLGSFTVTEGFQPYTVTIPASLSREVAAREEASELQIETSTWVPREFSSEPDNRELGVMLDRVEIR